MRKRTTQRAKQREDWRPKEPWRPQHIRSVTMDNPYFNGAHAITSTNPKKISVVKNLRESAVETLFARGKLDRAQKEAADRFRGIYESAGGTIGAMDYGREPVDGGGASDPLSQRQVDAGKMLAQCRNLLGARNFALVCKVCGQGMSLQQVAASKREQLTAADNLRASLDDLAAMWGYAQNRRTVSGYC